MCYCKILFYVYNETTLSTYNKFYLQPNFNVDWKSTFYLTTFQICCSFLSFIRMIKDKVNRAFVETKYQVHQFLYHCFIYIFFTMLQYFDIYHFSIQRILCLYLSYFRNEVLNNLLLIKKINILG